MHTVRPLSYTETSRCFTNVCTGLDEMLNLLTPYKNTIELLLFHTATIQVVSDFLK